MPFELHTGGVDFWEHMRRDPPLEARFSAAMTAGDIAGECNVTGLFESCSDITKFRHTPTSDRREQNQVQAVHVSGHC